MIINLIPQRRDDDQPTVSVSGDTITINGEAYDFAQLGEGATLPADAIDCEYIVGDVTRTDGVITVPLLLPHGARAPHETRFPEPIEAEGDVTLPMYNEPEPEVTEDED